MGCFSFLCCGWRSSGARDAQAARQARDGLEDIVRGYRKIAQLDLPPGAAHLFAEVRRSIIDLEALMRDVKMPKARQWLLPLPQEQADWEEVCPEGGFLLRRQMCMAAFGDDEWCVGCLFISDFGLAFDSGQMAGEDFSFQTGFLPWREIAQLAQSDPAAGRPKSLITASLAEGAERKFSVLQLQLSIPGDSEWLTEFWQLRLGDTSPERRWGVPADRRSSCDWTVPDMDEGVRVPPPTMQARLMGSGAAAGGQDSGRPPLLEARPKSVDFAGELPEPAPSLDRTVSILRQRKSSRRITRKWSENLSAGFADVAGATPQAQAPEQAPPLHVDKLPDIALSKARAALENEDCLPRFLRESAKAFELSATPWAKSARVGGTLVRRVAFRMKLPKDVPRVVQRLISLPEDTSVTALYRLRVGSEKLVLTYQTCTHDVTFGENFRIQETLAFAPAGDGAELSQWSEVIWVAPLPWTHGAIKSYIEKKAQAESRESVKALLAIVRELGA